MLTKVKADSLWPDVPELVLNLINRPSSDLFVASNIDGLEPVKASINTTPQGSADGESFTGSSVGKRNIVFTIGYNPDWATYTISELRALLYKYFMPKKRKRLVFETDEFPPVEISGYVESIEPNIFSKDPEVIISVICPEPDFIAIDPTEVTGMANDPADIFTYEGTVDTGVHLKVEKISGSNATTVSILDLIPELSLFEVDSGPTTTHFLEINSIPGEKYARLVAIAGGAVTSVLNKVEDDSVWPVLEPGPHEFQVTSNTGVQSWELTYYERFGGL